MFRAVISDITLVKSTFDAIAQIIDEAVFKFGPEGIELVAADRAKVAAVDFKLKKDAFDEYECDEERKVGLNLDNLMKILKRIKKTETLEITLDETGSRVVITARGKGVRSFFLPILTLAEEEVPPIDRLSFNAKAEVDADIVEEGVKDASTVADSVVIDIREGTFSMIAESESSRVEVKVDATVDPYLIVEGEGKARYPVDYLKKFMKAGKIVDRITVELSNDYPMKITFDAGTCYLAFILAPRVEE